jgi:uracil-DNA glycosylase family 4
VSDNPDIAPAQPTLPKRGRPKKGSKVEIVTPLLDLPGSSKDEKLAVLYDKWHACRRCFLATCRPNDDIVFAGGNSESKILFVGEAPGEQEEAKSSPFIGPSGQLLSEMLARMSDDTGIQELWKWWSKAPKRIKKDDTYFHEEVMKWRQEAFAFTNVVACRPPDNRTPVAAEIKACWERLYNIIYTLDPDIIFAVGKTAVQTLTRSNKAVTKYSGSLFDIQVPGRVRPYTYSVMPVAHPSYLLRVADWKVPGGQFETALKALYEGLKIADRKRFLDTGEPMPTRPHPLDK